MKIEVAIIAENIGLISSRRLQCSRALQQWPAVVSSEVGSMVVGFSYSLFKFVNSCFRYGACYCPLVAPGIRY